METPRSSLQAPSQTDEPVYPFQDDPNQRSTFGWSTAIQINSVSQKHCLGQSIHAWNAGGLGVAAQSSIKGLLPVAGNQAYDPVIMLVSQ
jgi:hypothetical protein